MASSSKSHQWTYDVFISFRGEDIRKNFVDHLFNDLEQKRIRVFRDDNELPKGEEISPELYKSIEQSRFLIVIFSKGYASSSWCLRELVKILECKEMEEPKYDVRIIFYDVKPDVVRKLTEGYAKAFEKHAVLNKTEISKWKDALFKATNLCGWDLQDLANGYEAKFIDIISREIIKLRDGPLHVGEKLVGLDVLLQKLNLLRFVGSNKVHMFGICGISGVGKTTIAKAIYNSMHTHFEGSCFCDDVQTLTQREGLIKVQMQIIENFMKIKDVKIWTSSEGSVIIKQRVASKPILLVLDDVNHCDQVEVDALAGSPDWFSPGSLIIFTSKDKQLLRSHDVEIYDMPFLQYYFAFELFCLYAFGKKHPTDDFIELASQLVKHLDGHPLALKVFGGCLYKKPVNVWKSKLDRLKTYLDAPIKEKLQPCLDGLDFDHKRTFLDIACSLIGETKDFAVNVLNDSDCFAENSIDFLVDRSLITVSRHNMSIQMHELIRSMAKEITREESNMPGSRSRLWGPSEEVYRVLSENKATEVVEVIGFWEEKHESSRKFVINGSAFSHMKNLRILKLPRNPNVNILGKLEYLSNNLRYLSWEGCPFKFLPLDFYPENIVAIDLSYSQIENLWITPMRFMRLKILNVSHCHNLKYTPDFTNITNLEKLNLEGCVSLVELHPSIGMLKKLLVLNMKNCKRLKSLHCTLEMDSLQVLNVSGCSMVNCVLKALDKMKNLLELHIHGTSITRLHSVLFSLTNLIRVSTFSQGWSRWRTTISHYSCLPKSLAWSSLVSLPLLRSVDLSYCNIYEVPENIEGLSCLENLDLSGNSFTSLPESLHNLSHLYTLRVSKCKKLEVFPDLPPSIKHLEASYCNVLTSLPRSLQYSSHLVVLEVDHCKNLEVLPELPPFIHFLCAVGCPKLCGNLTDEIQNPQQFDPRITSHVLRERRSSLFQHMATRSNLFEFFNEQENPDFAKAMGIKMHGNGIPQWFPNQSMGGEIKVEIPPFWCYSKFRGYAICIGFTVKLPCSIKCCVSNFDGACLHEFYSYNYPCKHDIILVRYVKKKLEMEGCKRFCYFFD